MAKEDESVSLKLKDIFENANLLQGRTEIESTVGPKIDGTIKLKEQAAGATAEASYGQIWVKNNTPNELYFQDDAGTDYQITGAKTLYWSATGANVRGETPDVSDFIIQSAGGNVLFQAIVGTAFIPVNLPNSAIVTGIIVYGSAGTSDVNYELNRITITNKTNTQMATAAIGTEDTTISNAAIDNSLYGYLIEMGENVGAGSAFAASDEIYGARITYTLNTPIS